MRLQKTSNAQPRLGGGTQLRVLHGDALAKLRELPDESVHCVITSPPYWGLRDYKTPPQIWERSDGSGLRSRCFGGVGLHGSNGSGKCEHVWGGMLPPKPGRGNKPGDFSTSSLTNPQRQDAMERATDSGSFCSKCGAWRGHLGLEPTPELYVEHLVAIFREVRRVLRKDGTLWLNLGDSFSSSAPGTWGDSLHQRGILAGVSNRRANASRKFRPATPAGLKSGDLCGIPWRIAFALQADGWWLRRDNIWFKPNPMPESVNGWRWERHRVKQRDVASRSKADWKIRPKGWQAGEGSHDKIPDGNYRKNGEEQTVAYYIDCPGCEKCGPNDGLILRKGNWRCTTSHEYVFQFAKSADYFCNAEAGREQQAASGIARERYGYNHAYKSQFAASPSDHRFPDGKKLLRKSDRGEDNGRNVQAVGSEAERRDEIGSFNNNPALRPKGNRNMRSVWTVATAPYPEAHFATFPPALIRPIILAATSPKVCAECGAPFAPVLERGEPDVVHQQNCGGDKDGKYMGHATKDFLSNGAENASEVKARILAGMVEKTVVDFRPTCLCLSVIGKASEPSFSSLPSVKSQSAIVLDPFGGSGTVGQVAIEEGRAAILIELAEHYLPLIHKRCSGITPKMQFA